MEVAVTTRKVQVFQTSRDFGDRLAQQSPLELSTDSEYDGLSIMVDANREYQTIEGFGGAFTEAMAVTFYKMSDSRQAEILRAYFDPDAGHGYTLCRTHINSCDFSLSNYAYANVEGDIDLVHFNIDRDRQALLPLIKEAQRVAGHRIKLLASPWSPPAWMKTTGQMNFGGRLKAQYRDTWARYYCRYIEAYSQEGVPIWGISVQNEPEATQTWDSCLYTGEEERDFIRDYLGPALRSTNLNDIRIVIWDHNRDHLYERAKIVYDDPDAAKFVWGAGFHWYVDDSFDNVRRVHDAYPDKQLLFTEGCQEGGPHLGEWGLGERYAHSMINDLNRWTVGWIDWNMVLNEKGGPNHVENYCSAPIIAETNTDMLHFQSSYYYLGHFSRFIRPGARRINCAPMRDALECTAFLNDDGQIAVVVLNRTENSIQFALRYNAEAVATAIPGRSIQTYCFPAE
jgi:glucosylceramidase